jgi:colanic acid/amylovoran biosynthesis glycosyltransferase
MKINLVYNSFPTPSETFLFNLATGLAGRGHEVRMIVASDSKNQRHYRTRMSEWSGKTIISPMASRSRVLYFLIVNLFQFVNFILLERRLLKNSFKILVKDFINAHTIYYANPDIIYISYSGLAINYINILKVNGKKAKIFVGARGSSEIVKTVTEPDRVNLLSKLWEKIDGVHCVSSDMRNRLISMGLKHSNYFINYPSIDIYRFSFNSKRKHNEFTNHWEYHILSTGRLYQEKGYIFALTAVAILIKKGYSIRYTILGEGPEREFLEFIASDLGINKYIYMPGKVNSNQVKTNLDGADLFLLPSIYEGISNAALEAMATGIPVVTTDAGGMSEVVTDGENGYITKRYDASVLADKIEQALKNTHNHDIITKKARCTIEEKFNLENQISVFENEFQKCL